MFSLEPCLLLYQLSPSSSCANLHSPLDRGRQRWALWQGSAHLRKLRTHPWYPLITTTPSLREKSQLRRSSWYRVALQWEGHDVYKVSLFLLLFPGHPISDFFFFFFLYCNFSIGIPDFHKGSLIHGWPSKSVFSRDSWFTAKGHSRVHGVNRVRGLYVYYLTPSGQDSSQLWCWWQNQSQMGMWPSPLRCGVSSGSIAGTMVGKPSSRVQIYLLKVILLILVLHCGFSLLRGSPSYQKGTIVYG